MGFHDDLAAEQAALLMERGFSRDQADLAVRSLSPSTVHVDRPLSNLAVSIRNREYIADLVLPKIKVSKLSDKYFVWNQANMFETNEDTRLGNEGDPGRVRYRLSTSTFSCEDYGLMDFVSRKEEENADAPLAPRMSATKIVTNRLALAKERRAAALVFATATYGSGNYSTLSGTTRWDNAASDPAQAIDDAIENCVVRPNVLVLGAQVWQKLKNHANIKELILGRASTTMGSVPLRVTTKLLADAFDLDAVIIGGAKYISTREGQTATYGYAWGKHAALIKVASAPDPRETDAFGYQFEFQPLETQVIDAPLPGLRGGVYVKVTQSVDEVSVAGGAAGYMFENAVA
jgi:hypothetical protein